LLLTIGWPRSLRFRRQRCAIAGDSAGGGLAYASLIKAREARQPMPACLVALSPWVNLGTENPSYDRLARVDLLLSRAIIDYYVPQYVGHHETRNPLISPLFADLVGLPPSLIQVGDHESFFGDAAAMHETLIAAGVESELTVWNRMFHVWHLHWPALEDGRLALEQAARFVTLRCA
jgi:epsilon-lactone hydrolase